MSSVVVDICNSAVIKLGAEPFNDLNDDTKEARLCRHQYEKVRDAVLRSAPWSFALKRAEITPTGASPEFGEHNVFQLPSGLVRVWKVMDAPDALPSDPDRIRYAIERDKLICDLPTAFIVYVRSDVEPAFFDANFKEALANALAADLCYSLTQSNSLRQDLVNMSDYWINQARSVNSQEVTPEDFEFNDFIASRISGHGPFFD